MMTTIKNKPRYVDVYDRIYDKINDGSYRIGDKLPGENQLARVYNVSRGTLRQALLILQENGLIQNKQGKGNYVLNNSKSLDVGLEKLFSIPERFCKTNIESRLINVMFEPPSTYSQNVLQIGPSNIIIVLHKDYITDGKVCAYTLCLSPSFILNEHNIDLGDKELIHTFVKEGLYKIGVRSKSKLIFTKAGQFLQKVLSVPKETQIITFEEFLYDSNGRVIANYRHSMLPEFFNYHFNRTI